MGDIEMVKVFVPSGASYDSTALLYKVLSETSDEVVARLFPSENTVTQRSRYIPVCTWLKNNVRDFDYEIYNQEKQHPSKDNWHQTQGSIASKFYNVAETSKEVSAAKIAIGYNTSNWNPSNWFFHHPDHNINSFYQNDCGFDDRDMAYCSRVEIRKTITDNTNVPIIWPIFETKDNKDAAMGKWMTYESIPFDLRELAPVSCSNQTQWNSGCGSCPSCQRFAWYQRRKSDGLTAFQIDDFIMKKASYGRYYRGPNKSRIIERDLAYQSELVI